MKRERKKPQLSDAACAVQRVKHVAQTRTRAHAVPRVRVVIDSNPHLASLVASAGNAAMGVAEIGETLDWEQLV